MFSFQLLITIDFCFDVEMDLGSSRAAKEEGDFLPTPQLTFRNISDLSVMYSKRIFQCPLSVNFNWVSAKHCCLNARRFLLACSPRICVGFSEGSPEFILHHWWGHYMILHQEKPPTHTYRLILLRSDAFVCKCGNFISALTLALCPLLFPPFSLFVHLFFLSLSLGFRVLPVPLVYLVLREKEVLG